MNKYLIAICILIWSPANAESKGPQYLLLKNPEKKMAEINPSFRYENCEEARNQWEIAGRPQMGEVQRKILMQEAAGRMYFYCGKDRAASVHK